MLNRDLTSEPRLYAVAMAIMLAVSLTWLSQAPAGSSAADAHDLDARLAGAHQQMPKAG